MSDPLRNSKIAKIKIASKTLSLEDDSYRALLKRVTGKESCAGMTSADLDLVLEEFKRLGFKPVKRRAGNRKMADSAQAAKIRALWLCLYQMGAVTDPSETALAHFVKRSCGIDDLHWIQPGTADQVIKALRGWMVRLGFEFPTSDFVQALLEYRWSYGIKENCDTNAIAIKLHLIKWQRTKLDIIRLGKQSLAIGDITILQNFALDRLIEDLGRAIRANG